MNGINSTNEENFTKLEFTNGEDITKEMLDAALEKNSFIHINLYNGHWAKNIYIPDDVPFGGGIVYITSKATYKSYLHVYDKEYIISNGEELVVLGSPVKNWEVVKPIS